MEHWAKFFFEKNHPKTSSKHVWTLLGTILGMFGFLNFFCFLKNFVWTLLGTILGIFGILKLFWFFWKFSNTRTSMEQWAKFFFEKITSKHVQNTFGHFWERFWAFLEFWNFFLILKNFVWTLLGTILGIFGILKLFWFFWKFSKTRLSMENWAKKFKKITLKHLQNTFGHFWERFRVLLEFWNFFDFFWKFSNTRPTMEHWAKNFFEKVTLKHLQSTFGHFWEGIWAFLDFWNFLVFLKIFEDSTLHGTLGKNFFRKNHT